MAFSVGTCRVGGWWLGRGPGGALLSVTWLWTDYDAALQDAANFGRFCGYGARRFFLTSGKGMGMGMGMEEDLTTEVHGNGTEGEGGSTIPGLWKEVGYFIEIDDSIRILPGEKGSAGALVSFHNAFLSSCQERIADLVAQLEAATERAAQAEAEAADLRCESSLIGELRTILGLGWGESITERCRELAALRQRGAAPVKVKLPDVEDVNGHLIKNNFSTTSYICMGEALRFAAANAVVEQQLVEGVSPDRLAAEVEALKEENLDLRRVVVKMQEASREYLDNAREILSSALAEVAEG